MLLLRPKLIKSLIIEKGKKHYGNHVILTYKHVKKELKSFENLPDYKFCKI
ncbi:hypothetical protein SAMN05444397_11263 [Flavobacterium aquidurense]|nr:hypothetical protein SAMN05444397_11263 [Flavobacterium aquidurense]